MLGKMFFLSKMYIILQEDNHSLLTRAAWREQIKRGKTEKYSEGL